MFPSRSCWSRWSADSALRTTTSSEVVRSRHTSSSSWMLADARSPAAVCSIEAISSNRSWWCDAATVDPFRCPRVEPACVVHRLSVAGALTLTRLWLMASDVCSPTHGSTEGMSPWTIGRRSTPTWTARAMSNGRGAGRQNEPHARAETVTAGSGERAPNGAAWLSSRRRRTTLFLCSALLSPSTDTSCSALNSRI